MIYSLYFITFRRKSWPSWQQFLILAIPEVFNATFVSLFVFACAPFFSKSFNSLVNVLLIPIPLVLVNLRDRKIFQTYRSVTSWINIAMIFLPIFTYFYILIWQSADSKDFRPSDQSPAGIAILTFVCLIVISFSNMANIFRIPCGLQKLFELYVYKNEENTKNGEEYHLIINYFLIAFLKIWFTFFVYVSVVVKMNGGDLLGQEPISGDTGTRYFWLICWVLSSGMN